MASTPVLRTHQRRARLQQRVLTGFVGALAVLTVAGGGMMVLGQGFGQPANAMDEASLNRRMMERVMVIDRALRAHAMRGERKDGEALLPSGAEFIAFVRSQPGGSELLVNPWNRMQQGVNLPVRQVSDYLTPAAELAAGQASVSMMVPLGLGHAPGEKVLGPLTYGTLAYDVDARASRYVLYGIGQLKDQAVAVHQAIGPR